MTECEGGRLEASFPKGRRSVRDYVDVRPCATFDLRDAEEQRRCFHYTNLQPLWAADNVRKWKHYEA